MERLRRSRSAPVTPRSPPLISAAMAAAAAIAGPPGGASRRDRPASAAWETNLDQCRRRGRAGPTTAPAFGGGTYHRSVLVRPCHRRHRHDRRTSPRRLPARSAGLRGFGDECRPEATAETPGGRRQGPHSAAAPDPGSSSFSPAGAGASAASGPLGIALRRLGHRARSWTTVTTAWPGDAPRDEAALRDAARSG